MSVRMYVHACICVCSCARPRALGCVSLSEERSDVLLRRLDSVSQVPVPRDETVKVVPVGVALLASLHHVDHAHLGRGKEGEA